MMKSIGEYIHFRMKEISINMSKQYELLKLVIQKMEIQTEDDNKDEGASGDSVMENTKFNKWSNAARKNLVRQSAVVAAWKSSLENAG